MKEWIKDFLDQHNDQNTFIHPELPEGTVHEQAQWIFEHSQAPWLEIVGIDAPYKAMLAEAQALKDLFVPHRSSDSQGWSSLCIHGVGATITSRPEDHGLDSGKVTYQWTEIAERCPETVRFFRDVFPFHTYQRVRYMLLEPGGYIAPHSDNVNNHVSAAVNISLNHPQNCRLTCVHGTVPFKDKGSVFLFNNHYQHAVHNNSTEDRYQMIVHGGWQPEWETLVVNSYRKAING